MTTHTDNVEELIGIVRESLKDKGFEIYPFKVGWYNALTSQAHQLPYESDNLAAVILSTPSMFEKVFVPFLQSRACDGIRDPIDECISHTVSSSVSMCCPNQSVDVMYDFELLPSRKPKFLAQTAAHVAGAAFYYRASDVHNPPWGNKKMFGVCIHPRLGGWFAIRALLIFKDVLMGEEFQQRDPPDCVSRQEERIELLERFNFHWQDWSYRDIIPVEERYSLQQKEYFITPPAQRGALLRQWGFITQSDAES